MLVWRLGHNNWGILGDSLLVGDDWVSLLEWALGVIFFEILEADLDVELSTSGNDVLTGLLSVAEDEWISLCELAETIDELWKVGGVLDLDGDTHDGGDGVFHDSDAAGIFVVRDGSLLHEVLIDTDETDGVTAWDIWDCLLYTSPSPRDLSTSRMPSSA